jgi:hypothetical protein
MHRHTGHRSMNTDTHGQRQRTAKHHCTAHALHTYRCERSTSHHQCSNTGPSARFSPTLPPRQPLHTPHTPTQERQKHHPTSPHAMSITMCVATTPHNNDAVAQGRGRRRRRAAPHAQRVQSALLTNADARRQRKHRCDSGAATAAMLYMQRLPFTASPCASTATSRG